MLDIARRFEDAGVAAIIYTDIARDGMLKGINWDATIALAEAISIPVIASGGLASIDDIKAMTRAAREQARGRHRRPRALRRAARRRRGAEADPRARGASDLMFKVRVIPCLDVKDGRVVKGVNFVNLRDAGDPVEAAIAYDAAGADELTFLDITASHENRDTIFDVVRRTAEACFMPLTVGGGVRTRRRHPQAADVPAPTRCRSTPPRWRGRAFVKEAAEKFGDQCIVVAIDAKKVSQPGEHDRWEIFTHGGRKPTGIDAVDYAARGGRARRRRDPAHLDGPRRHQVGLRHRAHPRGRGRRDGAGDRLGRRRHARSPGRGHPRRPRHARCWPPRSSISASTRCARPRTTWPRPACRCGSILSALAPFGPGQRRVQPVVAPEQFAVRRDEGRRAENPEPLRLVGLRAQAHLVVVRLRGGQRRSRRRRRAPSGSRSASPGRRSGGLRRTARGTPRCRIPRPIWRRPPGPTSAMRAASRLFCGNGSGRRNGSSRSAHSRSRSRHM